MLLDVPDQTTKKRTKWSRFKCYVNKRKCVAVAELRDNRVYIETLSIASVKRSFNRICNRVFKSRSSGYEKFLSDEEIRLQFHTDRSLVEGVY